MEKLREELRRSTRLVNIRLAEEEAEKYITLPGKRRFKKDSRTWLYKSSKKIKPKVSDVPPEAKLSPVKGVRLVSPIDTELNTSQDTDTTDCQTPEDQCKPAIPGDNPATLPGSPKVPIHKENLSSDDVTGNVWTGHSRQAAIKAKSLDTSLTQSSDNQLLAINKQSELKRNLTEINTTLNQKIQIRSEGVVLSDSELCIRANKLALVCNQDNKLRRTDGSHDISSDADKKVKTKTISTQKKVNGKKVHRLQLSEKRYKSGQNIQPADSKSSVSSKQAVTKSLCGAEHKVRSKDMLKQRVLKPPSGDKRIICSKQLTIKARKQLTKRTPLKKTPLRMLVKKLLQRKVSTEGVPKQKKASKTSVTSQNKKNSKTQIVDVASKKSTESARRVTIMPKRDIIGDLHETRSEEVSLHAFHSLSSLGHDRVFLSDHLLLSDPSGKSILGRSASEAAVNSTELKGEFLPLQKVNPPSPLSGKASRSDERIFRKSPTRKLSEDDTRIRKRKGSAEDRHKLTGNRSGSVIKEKRSRDNLTEAFSSQRGPSVTCVTDRSRTVTVKTASSSDSSLHVQCSRTVISLDDAESCPSSTVVEQGSVCSVVVSTPTGCPSSSRAINDDSLLGDDDSAYSPFRDEDHFSLAPSPGNHCLETIDLEDLDFTMEKDFATSAHELHRTKNLLSSAKIITDDDCWELLSKSDASVVASDVFTKE